MDSSKDPPIREEFKVLQQYRAEMEDGCLVDQDKFIQVMNQIIICRSLYGEAGKEEKEIFIRTFNLYNIRKIQEAVKIFKNKGHTNEEIFQALDSMLELMKSPAKISFEQMRQIRLIIGACDKKKKERDTKHANKVQVALTIWRSLKNEMDEERQKETASSKRGGPPCHLKNFLLGLNHNDKNFLRREMISPEGLEPISNEEAERTDCTALMEIKKPKKPELTPNDKRFLRSLRIVSDDDQKEAVE